MDTLDLVQFVWWQGVVEDRKDPLQLGRCRVRILGWHPQEKSAVPTNELPWAFALQDITSAAMSGIGHAPVGPVEGTWVIGFFRDGENAQEPIILGTIGGIPQEASPANSEGKVGIGFFDPDGIYPRQSINKAGVSTHGVNEPDTTRLARSVGVDIFGESSKEHPLVAQKLSTTDLGMQPPSLVLDPQSTQRWGVPLETNPVRVANSPETWTEIPTKAKDSEYPFNHVYESESGHVQEFDDTAGAERIHTFHRTGTFEEWHPSGDFMRKVVGTDYEIVQGDSDLLVKGNLNITTEQNARIRINNQFDVEVVDGAMRIIVRQGNADIQVQQGDANVFVQNNLVLEVQGNLTEKIGGNYTVEVGGVYRMQAGQVTIRAGTIFLN